MAKETTAVEMFVGGILVDPNTQSPVVILKSESGEVGLPIWIGPTEATSIASALKGIQVSRPLTHDLMDTIIDVFGGRVQRVMITELKDATYYAEIVVAVGDRVVVLDSRPSDAIAMAVRAACPIYVAQKVLDQAKVALPPEMQKGLPEGEEVATGQEHKTAQSQADEDILIESQIAGDFSSLDKDKWKDILDGLDPKDFKYKV